MFLLIVIGFLMGAGLSVGILLSATVYLRRWARMTRRKAQTAALIRERMRAVELVTHMLEQYERPERLEIIEECREMWVN